MNKILVEVSVGELLDKISILEIKKERITEAESVKFIQNEYSILFLIISLHLTHSLTREPFPLFQCNQQ